MKCEVFYLRELILWEARHVSEREGTLEADTTVKRPLRKEKVHKAAILKYEQLNLNLSALPGLEILGTGPN